MNPIQRIIKEDLIEPRLVQDAISTYGYVVDYNQDSNTATVNIFDKQIGRFVLYENVPMMDASNGVIPACPSIRTSVWIEFVGNNKNFPRASGIRSEEKVLLSSKAPKSAKESAASDNGNALPDFKGILSKYGDMLTTVSRWE